MNEEQAPMNSGEVSELIKKSDRIASGEDSDVFAVNGLVLKRYKNLSLSDLQIYQKIVSEAAIAINDLQINSILGNLFVKVNPITQVVESADNFEVITISPEVIGKNPNDLLRNGELSQKNFNNLSAQLDELSRVVMAEVSYRGIHIIPWNTLIVENDEKKQIVITDICKRLSDLAKF